MNTLLYNVRFEDGSVEAYEANVIAENIWRSVDNDGHYEDTLHRIVDHRITKEAENQYYVRDKHGKEHLRKTTRGVKIQVELKDDTDPFNKTRKLVRQWVALKDIKASHPIELAEYADANGIDSIIIMLECSYHVRLRRKPKMYNDVWIML